MCRLDLLEGVASEGVLIVLIFIEKLCKTAR